MNHVLSPSKNLNGYYKSAEVETLSALLLKREAAQVFGKGAKASKEALINNLVSLLYNYRQKCASQSSPS